MFLPEQTHLFLGIHNVVAGVVGMNHVRARPGDQLAWLIADSVITNPGNYKSRIPVGPPGLRTRYL